MPKYYLKDFGVEYDSDTDLYKSDKTSDPIDRIEFGNLFGEEILRQLDEIVQKDRAILFFIERRVEK